MTERGAGALEQATDRLNIGPSALRSTTEGLVIDIAERATPFGQRVAGQVKLAFDRPTESCFELDAAGEHWWWPIAPIARIDVAMDRPDLRGLAPRISIPTLVRDRSRRAFAPGTGVVGTARRVTVRFITTPS